MSGAESYTWRSTSRTDVGRVREINEDACLERPDLGLWVVADGMGGHTAGDVASAMIVETLAEIEPPGSLDAYVDEVEDRLLGVNARLREIAAHQDTQTIGSTVAAFLAHGRHGVCLWAGDSRIYRVRGARIEQVTQDHALVEELVEKGVLSAEQAASHPQGNLVTRAVGATDTLHVDAEIVELRDGDVFVMCSDGLDKEVEPEEIAQAVARDPAGALGDTLVDLALARGSRDNVTVVTVRIAGPGAAHAVPGERAGAEETLPTDEATRPSARDGPSPRDEG